MALRAGSGGWNAGMRIRGAGDGPGGETVSRTQMALGVGQRNLRELGAGESEDVSSTGGFAQENSYEESLSPLPMDSSITLRAQPMEKYCSETLNGSFYPRRA